VVRDEWDQYFDRPWSDDFQEKWVAAAAQRSPGRSLELADLLRTVRSICRGRVKFFLPEKGWGGIESGETPFDVWVFFSAIDGSGYRQLIEGQQVEFRWVPAIQDSWLCTATWVRALPGTPESTP
jgi:CspA family cold shock protein